MAWSGKAARSVQVLMPKVEDDSLPKVGKVAAVLQTGSS